MRRILLTTALVALTFATSVPRAGAQAAPVRVAMFGDSVMLGARDQLLARFSDTSATVDAVEDRSLLGAVSVLQAAQNPPSDVVVLDLGYNDGDDPTVFRQRIDAAVAVLSGVRKVIWLNQREFKAGRAGMNAELAAAATRYGNLEIVDWNAEVLAHPEYVYGDGIHLTPAGQSAMAALVRGRYDAYLASQQPTTTAPPSTTAQTAPVAAAGGARAAVAHSSPDRSALAVVVGIGAALVVTGALALLAQRRFGRA